MTSVGTIFKKARKSKDLSLNEVEQETHIKSEFVEAIEETKWSQLPEFTVVTGFVKNLSSFYGLDRNKMVALLRRDYPPKPVTINPKPDLEDRKLVWKPKFTFLLGVLALILVVGGYLGYQYYMFSQPPKLEIFVPNEGQVIYQRSITVTGKTNQDAVVTVNNQPTLMHEDSTFKAEVNVDENTSKIEIKAISRSGKETIEIRNIEVELDS